VAFDPAQSLYRSGYAVIRDEWQVLPGRFLISAGMRADYNSYRQLEFQPSLRLLYTPNARQSGWIAVSRAVRSPNRLDRDLEYDAGYEMAQGLPIHLRSSGNKAQLAETARSAEAGYRFQSGQRWSLDASAFYTQLEGLRGLAIPTMPEFSFAGGILAASLPMTTGNFGHGHSYGGEAWGTWQVRRGWRLVPAYSYVRDCLLLPPASATRTYTFDLIPLDLRHQASLRSQVDLTRRWQMDVMARARSREVNWGLPGAFLVDVRVGWRPSRNMEWNFCLNNVTDRRVVEASSEAATPAIPMRRLFMVKWTQRF
jgi:iron complex outermembrane receptor protein